MIPVQYVLIAVVSCLGTSHAFGTECNCRCDNKDICESTRSMKTAVDLNVVYLRQWTRHSNFVQRIHDRWDDEVESVHQLEVRFNETRDLLNSCLASQNEAEKSIQKISLSIETLEKQVNLTAIMRSVENVLETFKKEFANVSNQQITDKMKELLEKLCKDNTCKNGGTCYVEEDLSYRCECEVGFKGTHCDEFTCTPTEKEECGEAKCEIKDSRRKVTCVCPIGEVFDKGNKKCKEKLCKDNTCINGGMCHVEEDLSYTCECEVGFKGTHCDEFTCTPTEKEECGEAKCEIKDSSRKVTCVCPIGEVFDNRDKKCKAEGDRSISSLGPRVTSSTTEMPANINLETSTRDTSGLIPNKDCSCTYEHEDESVNAQIGNKILKFGDEIKIGEKVSFQCKYTRTFLKFQNGLKLQSTANMTCSACKKWKKRDVPTCENSEQSDSLIGFEENSNILPGGNTSIQQGVIHRFSCTNNWKQPEWNYGQRKDIFVTKESVSVSGISKVYITYLVIQKEATELNGEYECYIHEDQGERKSTFLYLQVTATTASTTDKEEEQVASEVYPDGVEPTPVGQCVLPVPPRIDTSVKPGDGIRFGNTPYSRQEFVRRGSFMGSIIDDSTFALEFKTAITSASGVMFYVTGTKHKDFVGLLMKNGKILYLFNCSTGSANITSQKIYNDGEWHRVVFSRKGKEGRLVIDDDEEVLGNSQGSASSLNVIAPFYIGGLSEVAAREAKNNLRGINIPFPGCLRHIEAQGELLTSKKPSLAENVTGCSDNVEEGAYFSHEGGYLVLYDKFNVGPKISIIFDIKPRNLSGILMAVHGKNDYLILQMVDGRVVVSDDYGVGPIRTMYEPQSSHFLCDGQWHTIQVVKNGNIISLAVDGDFQEPSIGVGGVRSTDTQDPLYIGGIPESSFSKRGVETREQFVGCIRYLVLNQTPQSLSQSRVTGQVTLNTCPTI